MQFSESDLYNGTPASVCQDTTNDFFVHYTCVQDKSDQASKYEILTLAVATASLISLLFVLVLQFLYKGGKIT